MFRVFWLLLLFGQSLWAQDEFYTRHAEGWFWYENHAQNNQEKPTHQTAQPETATQTMERFQKQLQESLNQAVLDPTVENVARYMRQQKQTLRRAEQFSESWQKALLYHPELDATRTYPINHIGRQVYLAQAQKEKLALLQKLSKQYGLMYFYQGNCAFCHEFAKTVKAFSQKHQWEVLAISLDGGKFPQFPDAKMNNGIAERFQIQTVPALIAVNPADQKVLPIAFGLISEEDLVERLALLTAEKQYD